MSSLTETMDFIEFHDGTIDAIEERGSGATGIVFDFLSVRGRRGTDHGGWRSAPHRRGRA